MENKNRSPFDFDVEKAALVKKSSTLESKLDIELGEVKEYLQEYGKNIAIIGGSLLATYLVVKLLTKSSDSKEYKYVNQNMAPSQPLVHVVKENTDSALTKQIKTSIALFLMSIAKQKLMNYLNQTMAKSE